MKDMCYQAEQPKTKPDLYIYSWSLRPEKQNQETKEIQGILACINLTMG